MGARVLTETPSGIFVSEELFWAMSDPVSRETFLRKDREKSARRRAIVRGVGAV